MADESGEDGSKDGIFGREFYSNGISSNQFQVNTTTKGNQDQSSVAMDAGGDFIVTWSGGYYADIYTRSFAATSDPAQSKSTEVQVTSAGSGECNTEPSVTLDSLSDYMVSWTGESVSYGCPSAMSDSDIKAVRIESGTSQPTFTVNAYTSGILNSSAVSMDSTGAFVITWKDDGGQDMSVDGIFSTVYDASGTPVSSNFLVNETTAGNQTVPSISSDDSDDFVVAWK